MYIASRQSPDSPQSGEGSHRVGNREHLNLTDDYLWRSSAKIGSGTS